MDFGKKFRTLTVLPFMAAVMIASALSPLTNVVVVNARGMGHEYAQPWRSKALTAITRAGETVRSRLRQMVEALEAHPLRGPALAGAAMLLAAIVAPDQLATVGMFGVLGSLKVYRQNDSDLRTELARVTKERAGIGEAVIAREKDKRQMTDDEATKFAALGKDIEKTKAQIEQNQTLLTAAEEAAEAERNAVTRPDPDKVAADKGKPAHIDVTDMTKQPGYFGRQLQAVYRFASERGQMENLAASDRDLLKPMMPASIKGAATGMNTDVGSDGGFVVAQDRSTTFVQRAYSVGEILSRLSPVSISETSNGIVLPAIDETSRADGSRYGGIVSGWLGQGNTLTSGKPKFRPMDLKLRKVGAFVYATDELLADARALESWINKYLPLELKFRVEDAIVNGTGSNQPLGVLTSGAVITITRAQSSRILSEDLRGMYNRLWAPLRGNAVFLIDQSCEGEFDTLAIPIGTGGSFDPSYKPAGSVPGQKYATYKNIPIIPVEYMAALGTSGDIVLTTFDEYTLINKGDVKQDVSLHVAFLTDEQVFRFMHRVDGQCNWNSALTPKSGGSTLSCVLKLS